MPGLLRLIFTWLRDYKLPDDKPENDFAFEGKFLNSEKSVDLIEKMHLKWKKLMVEGYENIEITNRSVEESKSFMNSSFKINGKNEKDSECPDYINSYSYVTK